MAEEKKEEVQAETPAPAKQGGGGKKVVAVIIDLAVTFMGGGYLVAAMTGGIVDGGFELNGGPAFVLFGLMIAYFYFGYKVYGKTVGLMVMGLAKK